MNRYFVIGALMLGSVPGIYAATSSCGAANPTTGAFTCNLYEADHGEYSNVVNTPTDINPGYIVLIEPGLALNSTNENNTANWSDILVFNTIGTDSAQVFSEGYSNYSGIISAAQSSGLVAFISEASSGPTTYVGGTNLNHTYNVYSDVATPEPSTFGFLGLAAFGLVIAARKRLQQQ
jgi:hypothetical protein